MKMMMIKNVNFQDIIQYVIIVIINQIKNLMVMFKIMNIKRFEKLFYDNVIRQFCVDKI